MSKTIIMTGGGTGGHLAIIKAVKEVLKGEKLIYIGSTKGQDKQWFEADDNFEETYFLETKGVVNQGFLGKIKSLFKIFIATLKVRKILKKHNASVVFSVGGFSSAPASFASKLSAIPLVIHEQNASLGSLNKLLKPLANTFISSYLKESPIHAYPIKEIFFKNAYVRKEVKTILFLGGSQGAKAINTLALSLARTLKDRNISILHQAGEKNIVEVQKAYEKLEIDAEVFGFSTQLADYMKKADFAIARSGASTLWELSASGLPTLYIPYPYASSDHQFHNAQFLLRKNLAWLMREKDINIDKVLKLLDQDLSSISQGLIEIVETEGSQKIANLLKEKF
ncbi:UDP-N-acetylglucosamine--N-acetylmuramyl-(pentapeptide) pyrophosphoryl-undecaprenol N-acetylglucosamine transferase [hydrothermal vent metagenome]|uniref:UDP-N-acetylglucosamine--N-acetylmuramyl-(Pentapeptide) pyrophosphoryl-undecaprenol N-acetylglucosamine transferase n=1 Tax=hydrothermal vent metagenome TaxID=652676 RepID=A0A1W1BZW8_9ZZZZ